ncbi:MAG: prepilin-type N-terminal cleavage/methylation domain-containing protein [Proteobacteria bacterium]|nr:prepilin-type N-terminal cleavage/methylation domain-containing protein [Pseudomonadota bacterium]
MLRSPFRLASVAHRASSLFPGRRNGRSRDKSRGFTLIELMIATVIIAIAATIASNGISGWLTRRLHTADVQEITSTLYRVRQQAIMRGEFNSVVIDGGMISFVTGYGQDGQGMQGFGDLNLEDSIEILQAMDNTPVMGLTVFYTNSGRLLTGTSQFRVCSSQLVGETPILFTISPSGQISSTPSPAPPCP